MKLAVFQVSVCTLKWKWYLTLTYERTFLRCFREVHNCPLIEFPLTSVCHACRHDKLYLRTIYNLIKIGVFHIFNKEILLYVQITATV